MWRLLKKELRDTFCSFLAHFGANDSQVARKLRVTIQTLEAHVINELFEDYNLTNDKKIKSATFYYKLSVTHKGKFGKLNKSPYPVDYGKY